jgi:hypothetical protein
MDSKNLVLLTSALYTRFGAFPKGERMSQMLRSLKSLSVVPNLHVIIADAGEQRWSDSEINEFRRSCASVEFVFLSDHPVIKSLKDCVSWDIVKNIGEVVILNNVCRLLKEKNHSFSRIYKLSGRYWLDDSFDVEQHSEFKFVFANSKPSQFSPDLTLGVPRQRPTRLYSLPFFFLETYLEVTRKMFEIMQRGPAKGFYLDVEHLFYLLLPHCLVKEVETIGVSGLLAPTGALVHD